jgi:hypothetical protein
MAVIVLKTIMTFYKGKKGGDAGFWATCVGIPTQLLLVCFALDCLNIVELTFTNFLKLM